jgi:NAD+ dependent glucose-6-phosphate dehydrogenase
MGRKRVLITGGGGLIGTVLRRRLDDSHELRLLTHRPIDEPSHVADIADLDAILPAFAGVDAVVHLAAVSSVEASWEEVLPTNIVGLRNVFEAAHRNGVGQVVFASSNHVIGMYERDGAPDIYGLVDRRVYDERVEPRPDSLYGVSKGFGELIGRYYSDRFGLRVICLRIGSVVDRPDADVVHDLARVADGPAESARQRRLGAIWLSHGDCAQLIARALDADDVRWAVVYGISDNARQFWDLTSARELLGYSPHDGAPA